jgi:hypothetical protein
MPFVVSTLSNDQCIHGWDKSKPLSGKIARPETSKHRVVIAGKANVANKILTPEGVITKIMDDEANFLKSNDSFIDFEKKGYMKIIARSADPDKVAKDMKDRDESAPLNPDKGDFEVGGRAGGGPQPGVQKII